jgi:hypothetical protein
MNIKKYQIYKLKVPVLENQSNKARPSVIIGINNTDKFLEYFGIYSHKKWWDERHPEVYSRLFAIHDLELTGLTVNDSFINISNPFTISMSEVKEAKLIGVLSNVDKNLLEAYLSRYYNEIKKNGIQKTYLQIREENSLEVKNENKLPIKQMPSKKLTSFKTKPKPKHNASSLTNSSKKNDGLHL